MGRAPSISAAMCAAGRSLADARLSPDGERVAFAVRDQAGARLVVVPAAGGPELTVAVDPPPAAGPGCFDWTPDACHLAYVTGDGRLCLVAATGGPGRTLATAPEGERLAAPVVSPDGAAVAFVAADREVLVVPIAGDEDPVRVGGDADFAFDPAWSPDARTLAWHEWDVPAMPWDEGRIVVRAADGSGSPVTVAGGPGEAVQQPRFSPAGDRLGFLSDRAGWLTLWLARPDGSDARPAIPGDEHEHADPAWGQGQRSWAWSPDGRAVALARNEDGFGRLLTVPAAGGPPAELGKGVHQALSWAADRVAAIRSGARTPTGVVALDPATGARALLARGPVGGFEPALVEPEVVSWEAEDGTLVHGRLSRPDDRGPHPLVVWAHGGPTGQRPVAFDARQAWFTDRGWAVLAPDPRGSSGWGRAFTQALRGGWGELDVSDVAAGIRAAKANAWGDPDRVVLMGASSGGTVVLSVLARHPGLVRAGIALYPVADLLDLAEKTHRFEAHYTWSLVGPLPGSEDLHRERSPLTTAHRITDPLLVLHGDADEVVPVEQSQALAQRVPSCQLHVYEGEGHGWRRPATVADELARVEAFVTSYVLGFPG